MAILQMELCKWIARMRCLKVYWARFARMISKAQVKEIRALATAKGRSEQGAFMAEGDKLAREWLSAGGAIRYVVALPSWLEEYGALVARHPEAKVMAVSEEELARVSSLQSPNGALVVAPLPGSPAELPGDEWCIALDNVQDPGNLGAIIRIADWFGIGHVVCSPGCADYHNPKVIGAAMGGHLRVQLHVAPLPLLFARCAMPILAATLHGMSASAVPKPAAAVLLIGNESKGIGAGALKYATQEVTIPRRGGAESLNAAVATGILLATLLPD
jgi:TrmH family RNA methyltransferase